EAPIPVPEVHSKSPSEVSKEVTKRDRARKQPERPIPPEWKPTEAHREFAAKHGLDVELEAIGFRGHFDGKLVASPNGRFTTWLANQVRWNRSRSGPTRPMVQTGAP